MPRIQLSRGVLCVQFSWDDKTVFVDVDHGMHFLDPAVPGLPHPHPLAPVGDLDPGAVGGDDDIPGEDFRRDRQREIHHIFIYGDVLWCLTEVR